MLSLHSLVLRVRGGRRASAFAGRLALPPARPGSVIASALAVALTFASAVPAADCVGARLGLNATRAFATLHAQPTRIPPDSAAKLQARRDSILLDSLEQAARRRVLTPVSVVAERVRAVPPPVATISLDTMALRAVPAATAYDLVRRVAGIEVHEQGQGPGFTSNAVIRGFNSDHSADVLLVVDGVPINAPVHGHVEGFADWNVLLPAAVQSMRVVHGPASALHGDFSLAGVVEVFTAADAEGTGGALTSSSFGDVGGWVRTGQRGARGGWLAATDLRRNQGWQENAGYLLGNGLLRGWRQVGAGRVEGGLQLYNSAWDSPGFVSIARYNDRDLTRVVDSTDGGSARRVIAHARYARPLGSVLGRPLAVEATGWAQQASSLMYLNVPGEGQVVRQTSEADRRTGAGGQVQLAWNIKLGEVVAGVSGRTDAADYVRHATLARQVATTEHSYDATYAATSAFVRVRRLVATRLALDLGGRVDALRYGVVDRLANVGEREKTTVVASPKLGARWLLPVMPRGASVSLLASASQGFRGAVGVIADATRPPHLARTWESGVEVTSPSLHLHAAWFHTRVTNERVFDPVSLGVSSAGSSRRQGLDVRTSWRAPFGLPDGVVAFGAATWNDARFLGDPTTVDGGLPVAPAPQPGIHDHNIPIVPGDPVPGVARYTGHVGVETLLPRGGSARLAWRVLGPFTPIGEPGLETRAASVLDLGGALPLRRLGLGNGVLADATLDLELQNVLDLRYVENRASGFITPGVPRVLRVGVRLGAGAHPDGAAHSH